MVVWCLSQDEFVITGLRGRIKEIKGPYMFQGCLLSLAGTVAADLDHLAEVLLVRSLHSCYSSSSSILGEWPAAQPTPGIGGWDMSLRAEYRCGLVLCCLGDPGARPPSPPSIC